MNTFATIWYGVPRLSGKIFRKVRVPLIVFLICVLGVPIVLATVIALASMINHSVVPAHILFAGFFQLEEPKARGAASPAVLRIVQTLTPEQLALGKHIAEFLMVVSFIGAIAGCWICIKIVNLFVQRIRGPFQHR